MNSTNNQNTTIREKIVIIRCGYHGEELKRVLKIKNFDDRCMSILRSAIQQWNKIPFNSPNWLTYRDNINRVLTLGGYEFEDADYDVIDDWEEES